MDLCYQLQQECSDDSYEESLKKWTSISQRYMPEFSAAGFFNINKTLLFTIVGNVATYFIIAVQLNESEYSKISTWWKYNNVVNKNQFINYYRQLVLLIRQLASCAPLINFLNSRNISQIKSEHDENAG